MEIFFFATQKDEKLNLVETTGEMWLHQKEAKQKSADKCK